MSSISLDASRGLAAAHWDAGQGYVAAPVLGNPSVAAARRLWILAAGPDIPGELEAMAGAASA